MKQNHSSQQQMNMSMEVMFEAAFEDAKAISAFVHESSYIDSPCRIGEHTEIMRFSHVMGHTIIGDNCFIGNNVTIASGVLIANNVKVMNNTQLNSGVILENDVYCGPNTVFTENRLIRAQQPSISRIAPTVVRRGSNIGANTTIGSGFTIGQGAFVEAGSVVDSHVPDFAIVYGNPVKFVGWQCQCGHALQFKPTSEHKEPQTECELCGRTYRQSSKFRIIQDFSQQDPLAS